MSQNKTSGVKFYREFSILLFSLSVCPLSGVLALISLSDFLLFDADVVLMSDCPLFDVVVGLVSKLF